MTFPTIRLRRLRKSPLTRNLVAETQLTPSQLVYPLFISDQIDHNTPIESMPGIYQQSIDHALGDIEEVLDAGVHTILLFGVPEGKDPQGTGAWDEDGVVQQATRIIREEFEKDVVIITDTCLCEYMNHGHCGIVMEGKVLNDPTIELIARTAVSQAAAGADMVAPSDMMDGRILWVREALDSAGYDDIPIMAYSAKYASSFYGPFRDAAQSAPAFGDRKSYQMDPRNVREAMEEVSLDLAEGADIVMVKPALAYLDVIQKVRELVSTPLAAYSVSGEYSMIKAAANNGWIDEKAAVLETLTGIKRAGADIIITYHAKEAAKWLNEA